MKERRKKVRKEGRKEGNGEIGFSMEWRALHGKFF